MALAASLSLISAISQSVTHTHLVPIKERERERMPISSLWNRYTVNSSAPSPLECLVVLCCIQATPLLPGFITKGTKWTGVVDFGHFLAVLEVKIPRWEQSIEIYSTDMLRLSWLNHIKSKYVSCLWICKAIITHCSNNHTNLWPSLVRSFYVLHKQLHKTDLIIFKIRFYWDHWIGDIKQYNCGLKPEVIHFKEHSK